MAYRRSCSLSSSRATVVHLYGWSEVTCKDQICFIPGIITQHHDNNDDSLTTERNTECGWRWEKFRHIDTIYKKVVARSWQLKSDEGVDEETWTRVMRDYLMEVRIRELHLYKMGIVDR